MEWLQTQLETLWEQAAEIWGAGGWAMYAIAAIALMSFFAFLVAPPIIGLLADLFGLRVGLGVLIASALLSASQFRAVATANQPEPVGSKST